MAEATTGASVTSGVTDSIDQAMKDKDLNIEINADELQTSVAGKTIYLWIGEVFKIFFDLVAEKYPKQVQDSIRMKDSEKELVSLGFSPFVDAICKQLGLSSDEMLAIGVTAMVILPRALIMVRYRPKKKVKNEGKQSKTDAATA